jgi:hypothetical protein
LKDLYDGVDNRGRMFKDHIRRCNTTFIFEVCTVLPVASSLIYVVKKKILEIVTVSVRLGEVDLSTDLGQMSHLINRPTLRMSCCIDEYIRLDAFY